MITFTKGNMFEIPADIRVNTVNCVGVMGAGVALAFKEQYPQMFKSYQKNCKNGKIQLGKMDIWANLTETIVNFPTKRHWKDKSRYEDIEEGLVDLQHFLEEYTKNRENIKMTLPALGCGHGGLDWERVKVLIEKHLSNINVEIFVFEPSDSHKLGEITLEEKKKKADYEIRQKNIFVLQDNEKCPLSIKSSIFENIHAKGNVDLLEKPILSILSSLKPDEKEINLTLEFVEKIASPEITLMVGYEPKISRPVIENAMKLNCSVVISFPQSILDFKVRKDLENIWDEKRTLVVSASEPNQKWSQSSASKADQIKASFATSVLITGNIHVSQTFTNQKEKLKQIFYFSESDYNHNTMIFLKSINAKPVGNLFNISDSYKKELITSMALNKK